MGGFGGVRVRLQTKALHRSVDSDGRYVRLVTQVSGSEAGAGRSGNGACGAPAPPPDYPRNLSHVPHRQDPSQKSGVGSHWADCGFC